MPVMTSPNAVIVNISDTLQPVKRKEFQRTLILGTSPNRRFGEFVLYQDITAMAEDFDEDTPEYKIATRILAQIPRPRDVAVYTFTPDESDPTSWSSALNDLINRGYTGWYFLVPATHDPNVIADLAEWITAQRRMLITGNSSEMTPAEIVEFVNGLFRSRRTVFCAHPDNDRVWLEGAVAGYAGAHFPGSVAWFHAKLQGLLDQSYKYSELAMLEENHVMSWWETPIGIWATTGGQAINGFWADLTHAIDFLEAQIKEAIWDLLVQRDKIPYTDEGILTIAAVVEAVLHRCAGAPYYIIATDLAGRPLCRVMPPRRQDIDPLEVKCRHIPDLPFVATVAGAVKSVVVNGVLTEEVITPLRVAELYGR